MDLILILLAILVIVIATMYRQEHMTNKDLVSKLQTYGTKDPEKEKKDSPSQAPIYGPKAEQPPAPSPSKGDAKGKDDANGSYPEIYGPEYQGVPGMKQTKPKHSSDDTSDDTYDYNPDLKKAFPVEGPPQPFLTDFSKFQK